MKKIFATMAVIAAFTLVSCEKEQFVETMAVVAGNDVITAYTESNPTKTSLSGDDSKGYDVVWSAGDKIKIGDNIFTLIAGEGTTQGTFQGTLPKEDGTYDVCYPETGCTFLENNIYAGTDISGSPMYSEVTISDGKINEPISFKNFGGILRLTLKGTATIRRIEVSGAGYHSLLCSSGVALDNKDGKAFYIPMPVVEAPATLVLHIYTIDGLHIIKQPKTGKYIVIERSKITDVSLNGINSSAPQGILPGEFSVADGSTVHFSKGNLRYTVDSGKWSFFDRQYDCGPSNYEDGHDREISLFTWGYHSTKSIVPDGNSGDNVNVSPGHNLDQNQDWGSQIGRWGAWRTLTKSEWDYLFTQRTDADKKYGYATVCGAKGIIILPDNFEDPGTNGGNGSFIPKSSNNVYTSGGDWEMMEYAGAVFLPVAGWRGGDRIYYSQDGLYWSSTAADPYSVSDESDEGKSAPVAYYLLLDASNTHTATSQRNIGCSVRLVSGTSTVTFDLNGKPGTAPQSIGNIMNGSTITKPASPTAEGYTFTGWYKDAECTSPWYFDTECVYSSITLYAGWTGGLISGKFSVSRSKQVYFSMGNLWADASGSNASNPELHLEGKQIRFNTEYDSSHISHFTWNSSVSGAVGASGSTGYLFCDESHKISVDGSPAMYYALSLDEWKYLFNTLGGGRSMSHYGKPTHSININYCGIRGLVIYPDDYTGEDLSSEVEYTEATFPEDCIFLPCAGWRDGSTIRLSDRWNGFYWSSSANDNQPYYLELVTEGVNLSAPGNANNAMSIRLVTTVE